MNQDPYFKDPRPWQYNVSIHRHREAVHRDCKGTAIIASGCVEKDQIKSSPGYYMQHREVTGAAPNQLIE
jgi:hypothetical protein